MGSQKKKKGKGPDPFALLSDGKKQKGIGLGAFRVKNYEKAIECWCMARGTMKHILDREFFKGNEEKIKETRDLETALWLNLAQAYLNNKEFYQCIGFCDKVFERDKEFPVEAEQKKKAIYGKAQAHIMGANFPEARRACHELSELEPASPIVKQLLLEIAQKEG